MRTVRSSGHISGGEVYLVPGGTWFRGGVPGPGRGCTWSQQGGVPGPGAWVYLVLAGGQGTWSLGAPGSGGGVPGQALPLPPAYRRLAKRTPSPLWTDRHL